MIAIISYNYTTYGCMPGSNGNIVDFSGGGTSSKVIEFTENPKLSNDIAALKSFQLQDKEYEFSNTVKFKRNFEVEVIAI